MSAPSSLTGAAARGSAATIAGQGARMTLQMTATVVLARLLSPHDFGLIAMVTAVIGVAELVRDFGLSLASIQAKEISRAERTNLFWANTALGAGSAFVAAAAASSSWAAGTASWQRRQRAELFAGTLQPQCFAWFHFS